MLTFSKWIGSVKREFSIAIGKTKNSMATIHVDASLLIYHQELRILSLVSWFFLFHKKCLLLRWAFQIENKVFWKTFLRWVRTLGEIIQWMISAIQEVPRLIIEPLRSLISGLRLKQFPKLFYSQNSRVLETRLFLALFSRRKVSVDDWITLKNKKYFSL